MKVNDCLYCKATCEKNGEYEKLFNDHKSTLDHWAIGFCYFSAMACFGYATYLTNSEVLFWMSVGMLGSMNLQLWLSSHIDNLNRARMHCYAHHIISKGRRL